MMGSGFASCRFIFGLLLVSQCIHSTCARRIVERNVENNNDNDIIDGHLMLNQHKHEIQTSTQAQAQGDPTFNIYFNIKNLKKGNKFLIYFSLKTPSTSPHLLSREESDSIPFSLSQLPQILDFLSFDKNSPQAKAMEYTLSTCEDEPLKGETKFCARSLESMLDSTHGIFGLDAEFKVMMTNFITNHTVSLQNYTVLEEVNEVLTPKMLACHTMPYPYAVYYCHGQKSDHKLFEIKLEGENGERINALGVCHMDTSQWDPDHYAFKALGTRPGVGPVCHFFPADNLVWVVTSSAI